MDYLVPVAAGLVGIVVGFAAFVLVMRQKRVSTRRQCEQMLAEAKIEADKTRKEAKLAAKEDLFKQREVFARETEATRKDLRQAERRLQKREDGLDQKVELLTKKEHLLEDRERKLSDSLRRAEGREKELDDVIRREMDILHKVSMLSPEEAKRLLMERLERQLEDESALAIQRSMERTREVADRRAAEIIITAIGRSAAVHTQETVVSTVDIPGDEMKGRIIGREGRNIRAFEKATGVDVIVDDTPGVVVVSGFDPIRREIARRSLEKLIMDGRIHPARIEEVVRETQKEIDGIVAEIGKQTAFDLQVPGIHPKLLQLIGCLKYRTSYGQNVLQHSIEVATLTALMASELKLDAQLAMRCGLLHDIGKAVDYEMEGSHMQIGADLARRYEESPVVINAVAGHHDDIDITNPYTVLVAAADAMSASRPGARRESLEKYIKRLERLEDVASGCDGVRNAYAIQAGREVRVIVDADKVGDKEAAKTCRAIAKQIEQELTYPGEVKVTLLREVRVVDYAK